MSRNKKKSDKFQYYAEDYACIYCLYYQGAKLGCSLTACCCGDFKQDTVIRGRIRRKRGGNQ